MNIRFIVLGLSVVSTGYAFMVDPLLALSFVPTLLINYWVWQDGKEIENLRSDIIYLMKKQRERNK